MISEVEFESESQHIVIIVLLNSIKLRFKPGVGLIPKYYNYVQVQPRSMVNG